MDVTALVKARRRLYGGLLGWLLYAVTMAAWLAVTTWYEWGLYESGVPYQDTQLPALLDDVVLLMATAGLAIGAAFANRVASGMLVVAMGWQTYHAAVLYLSDQSMAVRAILACLPILYSALVVLGIWGAFFVHSRSSHWITPAFDFRSWLPRWRSTVTPISRLRVVAAAVGIAIPVVLLLVLPAALYWMARWRLPNAVWGVAFLAALRPIYALYRLIRRHAMVDLRLLARVDNRPPVVLLRSFLDDALVVPRHEVVTNLEYRDVSHFEEVLTAAAWDIGPVIAISRPGESQPPIGAVRTQTSEVWQEDVDALIRNARAVLLVLGATDGLSWEIRRLVEVGAAAKTILVFPPISEGELFVRWSALRQMLSSLAIGRRLPVAFDFRGLAIWGDDHEAVTVVGDSKTTDYYICAVRTILAQNAI